MKMTPHVVGDLPEEVSAEERLQVKRSFVSAYGLYGDTSLEEYAANSAIPAVDRRLVLLYKFRTWCNTSMRLEHLRLFACDCAERMAERKLRHGDITRQDKIFQAIPLARQFAAGQSSPEEFSAFKETAYSDGRFFAVTRVDTWQAAVEAADKDEEGVGFYASVEHPYTAVFPLNMDEIQECSESMAARESEVGWQAQRLAFYISQLEELRHRYKEKP